MERRFFIATVEFDVGHLRDLTLALWRFYRIVLLSPQP